MALMRKVSLFGFFSALLALACGGTTDTGQTGIAGASSSTGGQPSIDGNGSMGGTTWGAGGFTGVGGTNPFDSRCPATQPGIGNVCSFAGLVCSYDYFNGCLCTADVVYPCTQVDPNCVGAQCSLNLRRLTQYERHDAAFARVRFATAGARLNTLDPKQDFLQTRRLRALIEWYSLS